MYGIGGDPFGAQQNNQDGGVFQANADRTQRMMAAQYNLALQRGDNAEAGNVFARMLGQWLANRFSR